MICGYIVDFKDGFTEVLLINILSIDLNPFQKGE